MSEAVLSARGLRTGFGSQAVLHGVDLEAAPGEATGVFGLNGAGKSVLLKTLAGVVPTWSGTITLLGRRIEGLSPERRVALGMAHVPQGRQVFGSLSVEQNLRVGGTMLRRRDRRGYREALEEVFELFPALAEKRHEPAGSLSGGQQAMLAIGRALVSRPRLVLVDEPSAGLAPAVVEELLELLMRVRAQGLTMVVVEQNVGFGLRLADTVVLLQRGVVVHRGPASDLAPELLASRLGVGRLALARSPVEGPARGLVGVAGRRAPGGLRAANGRTSRPRPRPSRPRPPGSSAS
jgi:branched-chain amino acid transport system ATP-binding protein